MEGSAELGWGRVAAELSCGLSSGAGQMLVVKGADKTGVRGGELRKVRGPRFEKC